jgi:beta-xylosidase
MKIRVLVSFFVVAIITVLLSTFIVNTAVETNTGLILNYKFNDGTGIKITDSSGNCFDGTLNGGCNWNVAPNGSGALEFDGENGYVKIPNGLLKGIADITVALNVYVDNSNVDPVWLFTFGSAYDPGTSENTKYFGLLEDGIGRFRGTITTNRWTSEQNTSKGTFLEKGVWKHITFTLSSNTGILYEDSVQIAKNDNVTVDPQDIESTIANYLGKPAYPADKYFKGKISDFRIYNRALAPTEIKSIWLESLGDTNSIISTAKTKLTIPNADDIRGNITLSDKVSVGTELVNVIWETDRTDVVNINSTDNSIYDSTPAGIVNRQDSDTKVTLKAKLTYGTLSDTKNITITVKAKSTPIREEDYKNYLFAYFNGTDRVDAEQIYFASSKDGLHWDELNGNNPVLTSAVGDKGVRDPFILRSPEGDKFYMVATDLRIANGDGWSAAQTSGSKSIVVWESYDLVNWSKERLVKVARDDAGCTWAPEVMYDDKTGEYLVYWASRIAQDNYAKQRIYISKTRDFYTFTEPETYIERTSDVIDATMIKQDGVYYRFTKDEVNKNIIIDKCDQLLHKAFEAVSSPSVGSQAGVEGPTIFKFNGQNKWCLLLDQYSGGGYYPLVTDDIKSMVFTRLNTSEYSLPSGPRHGTVIQITQKEYDAVMAKWSESLETPYNNPVLGGEYADPDIDIFDGKYYIYPTTDGYAGWSGTQFHAFSSDNMKDWKDCGVILDAGTNKDVSWSVGSAWAPTIEKKNGRYYFYFCAKRSDGKSCIGVATSDSPIGPFSAQPAPLITPEIAAKEGVSMWQTIDPSVFTDDDGRSYLLFGNGSAAVVELNQDMTSFKPGTMKNLNGAVDFREAVSVVKRNGIYHFTWSCDDTGSENYHVNYGTSNSLYGAIEYKYTVLSKDQSKGILGTGHHSILKIPEKDEYYIAYHRFATPIGKYTTGLGYHRETCIDKFTFDEKSGLMKVVVPTLEGIN